MVEMIQSDNLAELAARTGVNSDHEGIVFTKLKYRFTDFFRYFFFGIRYFSVFWNTDFGIGIGILKYLGIRYRYRLPTQD